MTTKIVKNWDTHQADYEYRDDEDVRSEAQATHSHRYHNHLLFLHNLEHHLFKGVYAVDAYPTMLKYVTYLHEKEDPLWDILTDHYAENDIKDVAALLAADFIMDCTNEDGIPDCEAPPPPEDKSRWYGPEDDYFTFGNSAR